MGIKKKSATRKKLKSSGNALGTVSLWQAAQKLKRTLEPMFKQ